MQFETVGTVLGAAGMWLALSEQAANRLNWRMAARGILMLLAALAGFAVLAASTQAAPGNTLIGGTAAIAGVTAAACLTNRRALPQVAAALIASLSCAWLAHAVAHGWLASMGATASLGHGAIDLAGLGLIGLTGGGTALGFNLLYRHDIDRLTLTLPKPAWQPLPIIGAILFLIGGMALIAALGTTEAAAVRQAHLLSQLLIVVAATVSAISYSLFTTTRVQAALVGRALIAAAVIGSSASLLPAPIALVVGVLATVCAIPGGFWLQERLGMQDTRGALGGVVAPSAIGILATGLFAHGGLLAGWGGVGVDLYLNAPNLGVVGWVIGGDIGQFSAQMTLLLTALSIPLGFSLVVAAAARQFLPGLVRENSQTTGVDIIRSHEPEPTPAVIDGDTLTKPKRTLPGMRAYKVAYPFKSRARRNAAPNFVVREDTDQPPSDNSL